jgi:phosphoenolpyruvate-protein kinase (PTS system EI component)
MVPTFLRPVSGDEQLQPSPIEGLVVHEGARTSKSAVMVRNKQGRQRSLISLVGFTSV